LKAEQGGTLSGQQLLIEPLDEEARQIAVRSEIRREEAGADEHDGDDQEPSPQGHGYSLGNRSA
jgi:hypothetical protein